MLENPEALHSPSEFIERYPLLFSANRQHGLELVSAQNRAFVGSLLPTPEERYEHLDAMVVGACTRVLNHTDYEYGRNIFQLGELQRREPDGIWAEFAMPTFYHNGDGTRLAMLGTVSYMDFMNQTYPDSSPYRDRVTYLKTLMTAACDDLIFGVYGRGGDELATMDLAEMLMQDIGFSPDFIRDVKIGIQASIFNELTGKQNIDPDAGALPVQEGGNIGDLWALGTPICTANSMLLGMENLWKRDTAHLHHQVFRNHALHMHVDNGWHGRGFYDFSNLLRGHEPSCNAYGVFLKGNGDFLRYIHTYPVEVVNELMRAGKEQNAILQSKIGHAALTGLLTVSQGFHCALSYAAESAGWQKDESGLALSRNPSGDEVSRLLLTRWPVRKLRRPRSAARFFARYMRSVQANA